MSLTKMVKEDKKGLCVKISKNLSILNKEFIKFGSVSNGVDEKN